MINYTAWPEMLAWPYLMLQGWLPYKDIAIAHNPLLLLDLVIFFKLFGVGIMQLKIYTWILITINICLTYFVTKKFWNNKIALLASLLYLVLSIVYDGNGLWFDLALTPFAILLYLFLRDKQSLPLRGKKYIWAGIVFALGFLTKQTFIYFAIPVGIAIVQSTQYRILRLKQFVIGTLPIIAVFTLYLFTNNLISSYYDWAIKFGILYLPNAVGQISLPTLKQLLFALFPFLIAVFSTEYLVLIFAIVGAMGVYPRWELFHFQPALPFVAIAISIFFFSHLKNLIKYLVFVFLLAFFIIGIKRNLGDFTRFHESDVQKVSSVISESKYKNIYVVNYWDNIYALTNTLPATKPLIPYIPWYLEYNNNLELVTNNLKTNMPDAIVIGERQNNNFSLYEFVDKFYTCTLMEKSLTTVRQVELCDRKNHSK